MQPEIRTQNGIFRGKIIENKFRGFLGIRYAEPPRRFHRAERLSEKWAGVKLATDYGPDCMHYDPLSRDVTGSEDCLYLNVFCPLDLDLSGITFTRHRWTRHPSKHDSNIQISILLSLL